MPSTRFRDTVDTDRLAEAALAILSLTLHGDGRVWKSIDWELMDLLHEKGWIVESRSRAKSVVLTEEGEQRTDEFFRKYFHHSPASAAEVPTAWHTVTPRVAVSDPAALVAFLKAVFYATGEFRRDAPSEIRIGDSVVMIGSAEARGAFTAFLYVYVDDVDATWKRAVRAGATTIEEPEAMPYGDRRATVRDPWGNLWQIATRQEGR